MLGGRKSAESLGLDIKSRDALYARMSAHPEGALFKHEDVVTCAQEAEDFANLRNIDYIHVGGGFLTRIIETDYLRRLPSVMSVVSHYENLHNVSLTETGDRTAWRNGLKEWEPLQGYRFYSNRISDVITLGHMKIQIIPAPSWLRIHQEDAVMFRCFYDQPLKDLTYSLLAAVQSSTVGKEALHRAANFGLGIQQQDVPEDWQSPQETAHRIIKFLDDRSKSGR